MSDLLPVQAPADDAAPPERAGRRGTKARWLALLVALAVIGTGAVFGSRLGTDPTLVRTPLIGTTVSDVELPGLETAGSLRLSELRGQVVVVNFWASWCVACREEHPALVAAARAYRDAGVTFVGVVFQDQPEAAVGFLDEMGRGGENYRNVTDPGSRAALDFGVFGVPETFIVDRDGVIQGKITGASTFPLLAGAIDQVLAGQTPQSRSVGPTQSTPSS